MAILPDIAAEQLPDGVYIGLPEEVYFAQDALGSSDLQRLHFEREGWWWSSRNNPDRKREETEALTFGAALHALLLEGLGAYETRFAVEPSKSDYPGLLVSTDELKQALLDEGFDLKGTSKYKKEDWEDTVVENLPGVSVWGAIMRDFQKALVGPDGTPRPAVSAPEDRALRIMHDAAMSDAEMKGLLGWGEDFPSLAELSFLWTDASGIRWRARFDKPVPLFTMDLKTVGNWQGRELQHFLGDHIIRGGLDIQVGHYQEARFLMHQLIAARGDAAISGGTEEQRTYLRAIVERDLPWDWVWLFYQKPDPAGRAPILFPVVEPWGGRFHTSGFRKARRAVDLYRKCVDRFGLDRPWYRIEQPHHTDPDHPEGPAISLPHFGWDDSPVDDEVAMMEKA
jgi:hypothetical protein